MKRTTQRTTRVRIEFDEADLCAMLSQMGWIPAEFKIYRVNITANGAGGVVILEQFETDSPDGEQVETEPTPMPADVTLVRIADDEPKEPAPGGQRP